MATVFLTSSASPDDRAYAHDELNRMRSSAQVDKFDVHQIADDPAESDIILFLENCSTIQHYAEVHDHPCYREYPEKCFLFSRNDHPLPFLPGVYASLEKRWYNPKRVRAGGYLRAFSHGFIRYVPDWSEHDYLYSFIGKANTHPVRQRIVQLNAEAGFLRDTAPFWPYGDLNEETRHNLQSEYCEVSLRSKFILCPRGRGTSSIRLFESLRMGRAPVIIADEWVPPEGPEWNSFSVLIPEKNVEQIPQVLKAREQEADDMGHRARRVWEDWFSREATFHRTVEWCLDIMRSRTHSERLLKWSLLPQMVRPIHAKALARHAVGSVRQRMTAYRSN